MARDFDYANFAQFRADGPPQDHIYQSNGFMALQERGFGGQNVIIPAVAEEHPTVHSDRLLAMQIDSPIVTDSANHVYSFAEGAAKRSLTYYADRTVYRAAFDGGPVITFTVYPVFGVASAVAKIRVQQTRGPVHVVLPTAGSGFGQLSDNAHPKQVTYGAHRWPIRICLATQPEATVRGSSFEWQLSDGAEAAVVLSSGGNLVEAEEALHLAMRSPDLLDRETHLRWSQYLASVPLVTPANAIQFTIGTSGQRESIKPEDLVRSQLWFWRGTLETTCQVTYMPACPQTIADWNVFMGMWSNDGTAEAMALSATNRRDLARSSILNWFRYSVNAHGDGSSAWTIFPSAKNTFAGEGPERETQGIAVQASLVGEYVRLTGDTAILDEKPGGVAGSRTLWQALVLYQKNLLADRDSNHDHLIDWLHTYETGWDDKNSPFVDCKRHPTSAVNEQVFNLWSLQEMIYLSRLRGEDPTSWQKEFEIAKAAAHSKLWDANTQRYWDLDVATGKLWTSAENLDAYYLLYYESDPARVKAMMKRLHDPAKFDGALLPTLAFDTPHWGGYWRGPAWPRVFSYVSLALARAGQSHDAWTWLARAINSNLGPILPEHVDPRGYPPGEHNLGSVRIMGYDALDCLVFPDVAGLRSWAGQDLTVARTPDLGKVYVRGQKWMGHEFDAILEPGRSTLLWQDGKAIPPLSPEKIWRASKNGSMVSFQPIQNAGASN